MRRILVLVALSAAPLLSLGCGPYTRVQMDLVTQARRGVALAAEHRAAQSAAAEQLAKFRRQRLDEAFDADVIDRGMELSPEWVIEHRKAYAAALDAYARERAAAAEFEEVSLRNLRDTDAALARLQWLQATQLKFAWPFEASSSVSQQFEFEAPGTSAGEEER